jgi:nitroimidazol reductase NimA-like FMN-containing flavoprotein (pyridoxamine 5'-phosphate oxidase superfamily)
MTTSDAVRELAERADAVVAANKYMVLGTTAADGSPWVSPVYFTPDGHAAYYWASSPDSSHSMNIARDPRTSITIFDSSVPIGQARAVYATGRAEIVPDEELEQAATLYAGRYPELRGYRADELRAPADLRLYRLRPDAHWILIPGRDPKYGRGIDSRRPVWEDQ